MLTKTPQTEQEKEENIHENYCGKIVEESEEESEESEEESEESEDESEERVRKNGRE